MKTTQSNLTPEIKAEIDAMSIHDILNAVRHAPAGDSRFVGERGDYWIKRLQELRSMDPGEYVQASKNIS